MPDVLELIARGIHRADELKGAPPWEEQSAFVREAQRERARRAREELFFAGLEIVPANWMDTDEFRLRAYCFKIKAEAAMKEGADMTGAETDG